MKKTRLLFLFILIATLSLLSANAFSQDRGKTLYDQWCAQCHGEKGDGKGPAADLVIPRPRDFTKGTYKFKRTASGESPADSDIERSIRNGNPGTSMPAWKRFSDSEVKSIVDYLKKFSPDTFEAKGSPIKIGKPSAGKEKLIAEGKQMYEKAKCWECHGKAGRGDGEKGWQEKFKDDWGNKAYPADQTSPWGYRNGNGVEDIFATITAGIDGTPMTSYGDTVSDEQRWALAYYVQSQQETRKLGLVLRMKKVKTIPASADDRMWQGADYLDLPLGGQLMFDPRGFTAMTTNARVRGVYSGSEIAVMLEWTGKKHNIGDDGHPPDAARVQFPSNTAEGAKPYFFMGDRKLGVDIWQWRASDNSVMELSGRGPADTVRKEKQNVQVIPSYRDGLYKVVFRRPLVMGNKGDTFFEEDKFTPFAVAIYDGRNDEENNKAAISAWYYMILEQPTPLRVYLMPPIVSLLTLCLGLVLHKIMKRKDRSRIDSNV